MCQLENLMLWFLCHSLKFQVAVWSELALLYSKCYTQKRWEFRTWWKRMTCLSSVIRNHRTISRPLFLRGSTAQKFLWLLLIHSLSTHRVWGLHGRRRGHKLWSLGLANGGVVETTLMRGVWGKGREEAIEVGQVGAIRNESGFVWTEMVVVFWGYFTV